MVDLIAFIGSLALLVGYQFFLRLRLRGDPLYSVHGVNKATRAAWVEAVMASGKSDGMVRPGPADLWTAVWLALVAFTTELVSSGEWTPEHPQVALTLGAAWDAISTAGKEKA